MGFLVSKTRTQPIPAGYLLEFAVIALSMLVPAVVRGQQIQSNIGPFSSADVPRTNLIPIGPPPPSTLPQNGYGQFDPYAIAPNSSFGSATPGLGTGLGSSLGPGVATIGPPTALSAPGLPASPPGASLFSRLFSRPASSTFGAGYGTTVPGPQLNAPIYGGAPGGGYNSGVYDAPSIYGPPVTYGPPTGYPSTTYPSSSPTSLFPGGLFSGAPFSNDISGQYSAYRLLQGPRLRHAFVGSGNDADDFQINDTDVSLVFTFPNFLYSAQPLYVVPSFSLHLWDGPQASTGADLPGSAYSGFLDVGWNSDPNQIFGTELGVRVGAFTDFDTFNSDSIRVLGKGLVSFRLTPTSTLKGGVYYLDRAKFNLLPAGGILWQPNPYTRFDLFFPEPKFARYWRTLGTRDVWWYLSADSGGGAWTIKRDSGATDSVDIFDIRAIFGLEWGMSDAIRTGSRSGFVEVGYVFEREIEYKSMRNRQFKQDDGIMIRAGIGY